MTRFQHINVLGIRKIIVLNSCFIVCIRTLRCVNYNKHSEIYSKVPLKYIRFLTNILDRLGKNLLESQGIRKYNKGIIVLISENWEDHEFRFIGLLQLSMITSEKSENFGLLTAVK